MNCKPLVAAAFALLLTLYSQLSTIHAQDTEFTYQGLVTDSGTNFTGTGQFEFALVTSTNSNNTATATAATPSGGAILGYTVTSEGNGYTAAPTVTISGGGGSGATATATISGGRVTAIVPTDYGNPATPYTSAPTVTIASPPPDITYSNYWNNDGSSGSEPESAVTVGVTNGLFTVILGNNALANMTAVPVDIFNEPNLQLRIWFNDGVNGFAVLSPVQNLTPTPYAVQALNASNVLGTVSADQLTGSVPVSQLSGTVPLSQLPGAVLTNGESSVNLNGSFTGNGAGVTNLQLSSLGAPGTFSTLSNYLEPQITLTVGLNPISLVTADVNGDGSPDVIDANSGTNTLTVLTNNGFGILGSNATLTVGNDPYFVSAANISGDGKHDLISANYGDSTLTVLTNNGFGVFGSNATLKVGYEPICVVAADVNGDGKLDLVAANGGSGTLTVLTNNGFGAFGSNATINLGAGSQPYTVVAADINGDGKPDLIAPNVNLGALLVFTNNGSGVFGSNATVNVGGEPIGVLVVTNFDGHGTMALIDSDYANNLLTIFTNNGSGVFGTNATIFVTNGPVARFVAADINGDGKPDLITANLNYGSGTTLTVFTNNGSGVFGLDTTLTVGNGPFSVAAADLLGNGKQDLISANEGTNFLSVIYNIQANLVSGPWLFANSADDFTGDFTGDGSGLTSLNASQLTTGTIADSVLAPDVALTDGSLTFTQPDIFNANVTITGSQPGDYNSPLVFIENTDTSSLSAPSLRVVGNGNTQNGVLSVSSQATGLIAQFGNAQAFVADITTNGTIDAAFFNGNGSNLTKLNAAQLTSGVVPSGVLPGFQSSSNYTLISGGQNNAIVLSADHSVIGGGLSGIIGANDSQATIGGGDANAILNISNNADYATIGGGENNTNSSNAGTVAGGQNNFAAGQYQSTVGGGYNNLASGNYGTVPGGFQNVAGGVSSFAAGAHAQATNSGAFVWSDNSVSTVFSSTNNNSFNIRASGGVRIATTTSGTVGATLLAGGTSWTTLSDRNAKKDFAPVDYQAVLDKLAQVPIQQWHYKWEADQATPNIGPMAQDFKHAFYPGRDDKGISTLEFDGVELAAIQGLNQKLNEKDAEIQTLKEQNDSLASRLDELEATVKSLAEKK